MTLSSLAPQLELTASGRVRRIERFGEYVVRQLQLRNPISAARLADAASGYLKGDLTGLESALPESSRSEKQHYDDWNEEQILRFHAALVAELDAFLISYLAFHWRHLEELLEQLLDDGSNSDHERRRLRFLVAAATRGRRFQRAMDELRTKRAFSTLVEELRAMGLGHGGGEVAAAENRRPVLLLVGGGMGAGKSTAVAAMLREGGFWANATRGAVVVEADAFKEADVVYRAVVARGEAGDAPLASQAVHESSARAASSLLVAALNAGRDVIFDGTMSWLPFVQQTIAMVRDVHVRRYRLGPGYVSNDVEEIYWVPDDGSDCDGDQSASPRPRLPYRIELLGVVCDPLLAVVRGVRRAASTRRAVPVQGQLRSHRLFATSLDVYCDLVDEARIYSSDRSPPELVGIKQGEGGSLVPTKPGGLDFVKKIASLRADAGSVAELYGDDCNAISSWAWDNIVLSSDREQRQELLHQMLGDSGDLRSLSYHDRDHDQPTPMLHHSTSSTF